MTPACGGQGEPREQDTKNEDATPIPVGEAADPAVDSAKAGEYGAFAGAKTSENVAFAGAEACENAVLGDVRQQEMEELLRVGEKKDLNIRG